MESANLTLDDFLPRFHLLRPQASRRARHSRQAAVLIPLIRRERPGILLTQRCAHLRHHAGQVAFPGGVMDSSDSSLIATALRETEEEIAIAPHQVEVVGVLPPVDSVTGFQVTPVVGIIPANLRYQANTDEVAAIFEMPLAEALRLSRYHALDIHHPGGLHRLWLSWYQHYFIWGLTAGMMRCLALQVGCKP